MTKIRKISLLEDKVFIWRGNNYRVHNMRTMSGASRIRLNDLLITQQDKGELKSWSYVGPGWTRTDFSVVDVPTVKKNVNAGSIAKDLDRIQGLGGLAKGMLADDEKYLKNIIADARHDLILLMLTLREIEEES